MKKILALLLSAAMVLCMMPSIAFAAVSDTAAAVTDITGGKLKLENSYNETSLIYNGDEQNPVVGVEKDGKIYTIKDLITAGYEVTYIHKDSGKTAKADAGETAVSVAPKTDSTGNIKGTVSGSYKINPKSIADSTVTVGYQPPVAAGETITAGDINLMDSKTGKRLSAEIDFDASDTTVPQETTGSVSVTVTGAGNYTGSRQVAFSIGTSLNSATIEVITYPDSFTYNGNQQTFSSVTVIDKSEGTGKTLEQNRDYVVSYENNINAGKNTAKLVIEGRGAYAGTKKVPFTINRRPISYVTVGDIPNQTIGSVPSPVIKDTGITGSPILKENIDYTLDCANHDKAGTATLNIRANENGNYTGYISKTFKVCKPLVAVIQTDPKPEYTYTGYVISPKVTVTAGKPSETYILNRDYIIKGVDNINAGTYKFYIEGVGDYAGQYGPYEYKITPRAINTGTVNLSSESFVYAGKEVTPTPTVTCNGRTLTKNVDYTVTYLNNNHIGTASVIVYGKGNYTGSLTKTFRIIGKDISSVSGTLSQSSYKYDGLEKKPTVTLYDGTKKLTAGIDYTVSYRNNRNAGTGEVIVTGKGNYGGTKTLTFRIIGKEQKVTSRYSKYYRTPESDSFNLNADHDGDGYLVYSSSDISVAEVSATGRVTVKGTGRAVITVSTAGTVRYEPASKRITIDVRPVTPAVKAVSAAKGKVKVTITKVEGATKYQVKYGRNGKYKNRYITHRDNEYVRIVSTIKNLPSKTHYIKVRAYKALDDGTKIWGKWVTKKVKVK